MSRSTHSAEVKAAAVKSLLSQERTYEQVAEELGCKTTLLYQWTAAVRRDKATKKAAKREARAAKPEAEARPGEDVVAMPDELTALRTENAMLRFLFARSVTGVAPQISA